MQKVIFLDRDGVINHDVGYLSKIDDCKFIDGVFDSLQYLQQKGFKLIIVTNQSGIGRGHYSIEDFEVLTNWMLAEFSKNNVIIDNVFYCPHRPEDNCQCRKPNPGMLLEADKIYNIDKQNSWLIGDKESDIGAANNFGINNTILVRSGHKTNEVMTKAKFILNSIKEVNGIIR